MKRIFYLFIFLTLLTFTSKANAQGVSDQGIALFNSNGNAKVVPSALITVCASTYIGLAPCSPPLLNTIFSDVALTKPLTNPFNADANGNFIFFLAPNATGYTYSINGVGVAGQVFLISPQTTVISSSGPTLNGTCIVSATQSLQTCLNNAVNHTEIHVPPGTFVYSSAAPLVTATAGINGVKIIGSGKYSTNIQYTGTSAIPALIDVAPATPSSQTLNNWTIRDLTLIGNSHSVDCIRFQSVVHSTIQDVNCINVTNYGLEWFFGVGNVINHFSCDPDGVGYLVVPVGCISLGENSQGAFTTSSIITPVGENLSGTALLCTGCSSNSFSATQISTNGTAMDIEPSALGHGPAIGNTCDGCLLENSSNANGLIVNGENNVFNGGIIAGIGVGIVDVKGFNNQFNNTQIGLGLKTELTAVNTILNHVLMSATLLTDLGINTQLIHNVDPGTGAQWKVTQPNFRSVIPASGTQSDLSSSDPQDHNATNCWTFLSTTPTTMSTTVLTTGKPWRAVLHGIWQNDIEGTGLVQLPEIQDVTSVANTIAVGGTIIITFSVNGSGQFQGVGNTSAKNAMFCGTLTMNPAPQNAAGTSSISMKGLISSAGGFTSTSATGVDFNVPLNSSIRIAGSGNYFLDLSNVTFRDAGGAPGGAVQFSGAVRPSVAGGSDLGTAPLPFGNIWIGTAATNNFKIQPSSTTGARIITLADPLSPTTVAWPLTIANGTAAMTTALIATVSCGTTVTVAATGVLTTDVIDTDFNAAVTAANMGLLTFHAWPTSGNVNFNYCNPTAASQTPTAMTVNWSVRRP